MVYPRGTRLEVEPVQYLYDGGWLYGRAARITLPGKSGDGWWPAAFEVDEIDSAFDWRTVIVHGGFYTLSEDGTEWERNERVRAIERLRQLVPSAFTPDDPTPALNVVFRIAVQEVTGRAAASDTSPPGSHPADPGGRGSAPLTGPDFDEALSPDMASPGATDDPANDDAASSGGSRAGAEPDAEAFFGTVRQTPILPTEERPSHG